MPAFQFSKVSVRQRMRLALATAAKPLKRGGAAVASASTAHSTQHNTGDTCGLAEEVQVAVLLQAQTANKAGSVHL